MKGELGSGLAYKSDVVEMGIQRVKGAIRGLKSPSVSALIYQPLEKWLRRNWNIKKTTLPSPLNGPIRLFLGCHRRLFQRFQTGKMWRLFWKPYSVWKETLSPEEIKAVWSHAGNLAPFLYSHYRLNEWINFSPVLLVIATLRKTESYLVVSATSAPTIMNGLAGESCLFSS